MFTISILFLFYTLCSLANTDGICSSPFTLITYKNGTSDCLHCKECPVGTIATKNCPTHDTECTKCYRSAQLREDGNTCNPCGVCEPGSYLQKNCTKFNDTICTPCINGTFSATQNAEHCLKCGNCTGRITEKECNTSTDVVCTEKDVLSKSETASVISIVTWIIVEVIATIIFIFYIVIKHRRKVKKEMLNKQIRGDHRSETVPLKVDSTDETQANTEPALENSNTDETQAEKEAKVIPDKSKLKEDLKQYMDYIGVLVMGVAEHQGDSGERDKAARKGQESREQTRPIIVLRIGRDYGITALQALKKELDSGVGDSNTDYTKLKDDNVYIEFHKDDKSGDVVKCRVSNDTPVFEDEELDIVVLQIKQDDSDSNRSFKPLKLIESDHEHLSKLHLQDFKTIMKIKSNAKGSESYLSSVSLNAGTDSAENVLLNILANFTSFKKRIPKDFQNILKISIQELVRNINTKGSEKFENKPEEFENNEYVKEAFKHPLDPTDVTTIFICGEYSSGLPCFTYDNAGKLQVYCILTHRVPKIFHVLDEKDQRKCFKKSMPLVTAGIKITAILKKAEEKKIKKLINAITKTS